MPRSRRRRPRPTRPRWRSNRRRGLTASARAARPVRTCIGCRRTAAVDELVRFHLTPNGLALGPGPGRGAWLCRNHPTRCLEEARRRRAVGRALRHQIRDDEIDLLRARLGACGVPVTDETGEVCNTK